jgi:uncharacterized protein (TIGR03083 family)
MCVSALLPLADRDWSQAAGDLEWSARETLEHVVEGLVFYARDLATPVAELGAAELRLVPAEGASVAALVDGMRQAAAVVASVVNGTPDDVRAFHPWGMADRSGFAAMACDELLVHTADITNGLGARFEPPDDLCQRVLARLFPWAPEDGSAWQRLLWANGRTGLPEWPRISSPWRWHAAPLDEWDGTVPGFARSDR